MRKALPVAAAAAVLLLAIFAAFMWKAEKRDTEDLSLAFLQAHRSDAALASSLLPLLDRLEGLTTALQAKQPGSPGYDETSLQIVEVRNLLASQMPSLAAGSDAEGNAVLIPYNEARRFLVDMASWREE